MKKSKTITTTAIEMPFSLKKYYYILGILVFFLFANSIGNGYNMDDELVTRNHKLTSRGLEAAGDIFTSNYYSDDMGYAYGYRPIVHLSFAIEHQFFGEKPGVSHFFNVILYVLTVLLFFKLLMKWLGEKGLVVALIAAVLFAVHPVHTEVVASIKNRDEILAFLFVMLAGLSVEKFLDRKKWISLAWIAVFFSLAMLSKKSVFPMAILFPIIAVFLKQINVKPLILISVVLLIPAVLIGSEFNYFRMLTMTGVISIAIFLAFLIRLVFEKDINWKKVLLDYRLIAALSAVIFCLSLWENKVLYLYVALLILIPVYAQSKRNITLVFLSFLLVSSWFFENLEMIHFGLFVTFYLSFENLLEKKKEWVFYLFALLFVGVLFLINWKINGLYFILAIFFFLYFLHKKWIVAVLYSILVVAIIFFLREKFPFFAMLLILFSTLKLLKVYWKKFNMLPSILGGGILLIFTFSLIHKQFPFQYPQENQVVFAPKKSTQDIKREIGVDNKSFLKEGRSLEMIENTLVLQHTKAETVATGAATLGEYLRLMVFPAELSFYYGFAKTKTVSLNNPWVWVSIAVHLMLIFLAFWQLKKRPLLSIGIAWYLLCILLFSNWVELVAGMVGERLTFTASAGFCIFIASVIVWIKPQFSFQKLAAAEYVFIALTLVFVGRTFARNNNWKTPLTLMGNDISHLENSAQANNLYALKLMESSFTATDETLESNQAKQRLAIEHFDQSFQIWPQFFNAAYDKGRAAMSLKDTTAAIDGFEKAVAIGSDNFLDPYYQLGDLYVQTKRNADYLNLTKKIFEISKNTPEGYNVLARGYFLNNYKDSAKVVLESGISKFPADQNLKNNLELMEKE